MLVIKYQGTEKGKHEQYLLGLKWSVKECPHKVHVHLTFRLWLHLEIGSLHM